MGGWSFEPNGRSRLRTKRDRGTLLQLTLPMTDEELQECNALVRRQLPPPSIRTTYNGTALSSREVAFSCDQPLATEVADVEGNRRASKRKTRIELIRRSAGKTG